MKLDRKKTNVERNQRVQELLIEFSLKKCENARIGIPNIIAGISGGERKRLSFATEILGDP